MNTALRLLRDELTWLEHTRHNAVKELANVQVPAGMAQGLLDRLEFEMLEIECAIDSLTRYAALVDERTQMELFG